MLISSPTARRAVAGAIGAGALAGAMFFLASPPALADPPENCTAADLADISGDVAEETATYLFDHPDVNAFFTSLKGQPKDELRDDVQNYLNANPTVQADLQAIRQPLIDLKNRCQQ
jgi:hemophore-related protein